jgi:hypothetical protein
MTLWPSPFNPGQKPSPGKFRRVIPEVWFKIIHVSDDHVKDSVKLREQTVEIALGPEGAFGNGNSRCSNFSWCYSLAFPMPL